MECEITGPNTAGMWSVALGRQGLTLTLEEMVTLREGLDDYLSLPKKHAYIQTDKGQSKTCHLVTENGTLFCRPQQTRLVMTNDALWCGPCSREAARHA